HNGTREQIAENVVKVELIEHGRDPIGQPTSRKAIAPKSWKPLPLGQGPSAQPNFCALGYSVARVCQAYCGRLRPNQDHVAVVRGLIYQWAASATRSGWTVGGRARCRRRSPGKRSVRRAGVGGSQL